MASVSVETAIVDAMSALDFDFEEYNEGGRRGRIGFAPDAVIEVCESAPSTIALLFSNSRELPIAASSALYIATLAWVLNLDFTGWLAEEMRRRGTQRPWKRSRAFGSFRVTAEFICEDAVLLTFESRRGRAGTSEVDA